MEPVGSDHQVEATGFGALEGDVHPVLVLIEGDGPEQRADLLARTVQRAFESEPAIPDATLRDLAAATGTLITGLITGLIDADRAASGLPEI